MSITKISNKPISILKNSSISEVIKKLLENNLSRLIVQEKGKAVWSLLKMFLTKNRLD